MVKAKKTHFQNIVIGVLLTVCMEVLSKSQESSDIEYSVLNDGPHLTDSMQAMPDSEFLTKIYSQWSEWGRCSKTCQQSRKRRCLDKIQCGKSYLKQKQKCVTRKSCASTSHRKPVILLGLTKNDQLVKQILFKILYSPWTPWSVCSRSCKKRRHRKCVQPTMCGISSIHEERTCRRANLECNKRVTIGVSFNSSKKHQNISHAFRNSSRSSEKSTERRSSDIHTSLNFTCGIQQAPRRRTVRVVGGKQSEKFAWPWQVAILKSREQFCGGTLIAPEWILTAAHCVRKKNRRRRIKVKVGEHHIHSDDKHEQFIKIKKVFAHPDYDFNTITNDIALLKIAKPLEASRSVGFACLPEKSDKLQEHEMCYIIGWGKVNSTDITGSSILREAKVPLVNRKTCQNAFNYQIHETQVCAGSKHGGTDSCAGDSGGPLLCPKIGSDSKKRFMVYGVTSYGEGCGEKRKFGIYTKVRKYIDWINSVMTID